MQIVGFWGSTISDYPHVSHICVVTLNFGVEILQFIGLHFKSFLSI